jgi:anti-anti-sigma factor
VTDLARVDVEQHADRTITTITGEVDISNIDAVRAKFEHHLDTASCHVVDLSHTTYLDSAAIALLFDASKRLQERRQVLMIVTPRGSPVRRLLDLTGLSARVEVHDRLEDAI